MHIRSTLLALPALTLAKPLSFPLADGFDGTKANDLSMVRKKAGDFLSNAGPLSKAPDEETLTSLRLIAFNEIFEVAFFSELITNVTSKAAGYDEKAISTNRTELLRDLYAIKNQEEIHALYANNALKEAKFDPIQPCKYDFPVTNYKDAIAFASKFTDLVLGTLQDVQVAMAKKGDANLICGISSVIGQEGEQEGYYRHILGKTPSSSPFLTRATRDFAFTAVQQHVVKGSCPKLENMGLKTFKPLDYVPKDPNAPRIAPMNQTLTFATSGEPIDDKTHKMVYMTGQFVPAAIPIKNVKCNGSKHHCTFSADFPFESKAGFSKGLTIAAVTDKPGPFKDADAVAKDTVFGPGLLEVAGYHLSGDPAATQGSGDE